MRSHHPRWIIIFYYPREVSPEMGPTGILPGATYTTIDHNDSTYLLHTTLLYNSLAVSLCALFSLSYTLLLCGAGNQDLLQDVLEAYLETDEINARKSTHQKTMTAELQAAGTCPR